MKRYFFAFTLNALLAVGLFSCTDPATDIKEEETSATDSAGINTPATVYPTDTTTAPILADTTTIRR